MEIKVKIEAPGLEGAIHTFAQVLAGMDLPQTQPSVEVEKPAEIKEEINPDSSPNQKAEPEETVVSADKVEPEVKFETVRVKLTELAQAGKQKQVKELITSLGAKKLSEIPEDKYAEVLEKAENL